MTILYSKFYVDGKPVRVEPMQLSRLYRRGDELTMYSQRYRVIFVDYVDDEAQVVDLVLMEKKPNAPSKQTPGL
jgi:hypothetical protein